MSKKKPVMATDVVREALEMVVAWSHGLRHETSHENKMVKAAKEALAALSEREKSEDELVQVASEAIAATFSAIGHQYPGRWYAEARAAILALSDAGVLAVRE